MAGLPLVMEEGTRFRLDNLAPLVVYQIHQCCSLGVDSETLNFLFTFITLNVYPSCKLYSMFVEYCCYVAT